ncbi:hypothetical protein DFJ63DRAFT_338146 [Scheffersomyces coipomensis]|uniref:uncharacterized protein n=1 Tax=Scheffersomyces coipomensis TaxID=1788519 RepID=UPI00315C4E9D
MLETEEIVQKIDREEESIQQLETIRSNTQLLYIIQECNVKIAEHSFHIKTLRQELSKSHKYYSSDLYNMKPQFYTAFQLCQFDCPDLDQKVQYMMEQLQFKIYSVEQNNLAKKDFNQDKETKKVNESNLKVMELYLKLLDKSLNEYKSKNISTLTPVRSETLVQKKLSIESVLNWELTITTIEAKNIVHAEPVKLFRKRVESMIVFSIDGEEKARSSFSKSKIWNESIRLNVKFGRELEILVLDKPDSQYIPVAVNWIYLFELNEEFDKSQNTEISLTDPQIQFTLRLEPIGEITLRLSLKKRTNYGQAL